MTMVLEYRVKNSDEITRVKFSPEKQNEGFELLKTLMPSINWHTIYHEGRGEQIRREPGDPEHKRCNCQKATRIVYADDNA